MRIVDKLWHDASFFWEKKTSKITRLKFLSEQKQGVRVQSSEQLMTS